jgi:hypothetical protein
VYISGNSGKFGGYSVITNTLHNFTNTDIDNNINNTSSLKQIIGKNEKGKVFVASFLDGIRLFSLDGIPPTSTATATGSIRDGFTYYYSNVSLALNATDPNNVSSILYCFSVNCTPTTQYTTPINLTETTVVYYTSVDTFNNTEELEFISIRIDKEQPNNVTFSPEFAYTITNETLRVTASAFDNTRPNRLYYCQTENTTCSNYSISTFVYAFDTISENTTYSATFTVTGKGQVITGFSVSITVTI